MVDRRFVDRTGLSGAFDFTLEWIPDPVPVRVLSPGRTPQSLPPMPPSVPVANAANFLAALEQQLGLALVPESETEPGLIVDEIELPSLD